MLITAWDISTNTTQVWDSFFRASKITPFNTVNSWLIHKQETHANSFLGARFEYWSVGVLNNLNFDHNLWVVKFKMSSWNLKRFMGESVTKSFFSLCIAWHAAVFTVNNTYLYKDSLLSQSIKVGEILFQPFWLSRV